MTIKRRSGEFFQGDKARDPLESLMWKVTEGAVWQTDGVVEFTGVWGEETK